MPYTTEQLRKIYRRLPAKIQEVIAAVETDEAIVAIGQKNNLHIDQIGALNEAVLAVLFGTIKAHQFVDTVQASLKIDRPLAEAVSQDINEQIFLPIRAELQQISAATEEGTAPAAEEPTPPLAEAPDLAAALPSREEILDGIENPVSPAGGPPPAEPAPSLIEQKRSGPFTLPKTETATTDWPGAAAEEKPPPDPYRESTN